jgi:hypothetical protein
MHQNAIVYQSYGPSEQFQNELTYSLRSLLRFGRHYKIFLVTTGEVDRRDLPVETVKISQETLRDWVGTHCYIHRAKIMAIDLALREIATNILYTDTDTIFTKPPDAVFERIGPGRTVMHCRERKVGSFPNIQRFMNDRKIERPYMDRDSIMFNAGVIGISKSNLDLLKDVRSITDELNDAGALDYFNTTEQLAFSHVLRSKTSPGLANGEIDHYWRWKSMMYRLCAPDMAIRARDQFHARAATFVPRETPRIQFAARAFSKLRTAPYRAYQPLDWAYYCYLEALSHRQSDVLFANVLADHALAELSVNAPDTHLEQLFRRFSHQRIDAERWLSPEARAAWKRYWLGDQATT